MWEVVGSRAQGRALAMEPGPVLASLGASQARWAKMQSTQCSLSGPFGEMGAFSAGRGLKAGDGGTGRP